MDKKELKYIKHLSRIFTSEIIHGGRRGYEFLEALSVALSYRRIPKSFWIRHKDNVFSYYDFSYASKHKLRLIHKIFCDEIIRRIRCQKKVCGKTMKADNYFRLLHALTLLKANKEETVKVLSRTNNESLEAALQIWPLDVDAEASARIEECLRLITSAKI